MPPLLSRSAIITHVFGLAMAAESQQWYIEEIPAIEKDDDSGDLAYEREKKSERGDTAPKAFIALDIGAAAKLDTPQSKVRHHFHSRFCHP